MTGKEKFGQTSFQRVRISRQFFYFCVVGSIGFLWDTGTVYALRSSIGLYAAGTAGFVVAASANWLLNRVWTFRHRFHESPYKQWGKFIAANAVGFVFNRGTFFVLVSTSETCTRHPVIAIAAGSFAGLIFNYLLSKKFVFR